MADKYSSSASLMSAKDSSNQEHIISNATVRQALSEPFEIKAMLEIFRWRSSRNLSAHEAYAMLKFQVAVPIIGIAT